MVLIQKNFEEEGNGHATAAFKPCYVGVWAVGHGVSGLGGWSSEGCRSESGLFAIPNSLIFQCVSGSANALIGRRA